VSDQPTVLRYTAFTDDPRGGNPAGVVLADRMPSASSMQRIAGEVGFSETAFVAAAGPGARFEVRYFSPAREVPFCGHATIAAAVVLAERDHDLTDLVLATAAGRVPVALTRGHGAITATLTSPPASHEPAETAVLDAALAAFGWDRGVLAFEPEPVVASVGAHHLLLPLASRQVLAGMAYGFEELRALMLEQDWTTVAAIWRERADRYHARNAFAAGGVVEDPATGAAAAALGGYLRDLGALVPPASFEILQGADMSRPSVLRVEIPTEGDGIRVSGTAVRMA
jgi:PhzF family phenazine biosynthesis protein